MSQPVNDDAIDFFEIDQDITLRRMVLRNSNPKGTVLFLHGFPEPAHRNIVPALPLASRPLRPDHPINGIRQYFVPLRSQRRSAVRLRPDLA